MAGCSVRFGLCGSPIRGGTVEASSSYSMQSVMSMSVGLAGIILGNLASLNHRLLEIAQCPSCHEGIEEELAEMGPPSRTDPGLSYTFSRSR
ncbi:hypothetical protein AOLI_G00223830 [Acnodon oligacanthus]